MPYVPARSAFQSEDQMADPAMTASGLTVLTRIPCGPPSSARQRARRSEAALADEYAEALAPATSAFLEPTKTTEPPVPWAISTRKASRAARKYPRASTRWLCSQSSTEVS